ncbi:MAG: PilN domain-containing protein [Ignavibacteria bacterium]
MSQQINLYDPSLLRRRELLSAANLAIASGVLVVLLGVWGGVVRSRLGAVEGESQMLAPQVQTIQTQKDMLQAQLAAMKPDPQIEADLAAARGLLDLHSRQLGELKKGVGTESGGFAEYLRGFARQTPAGLWLTGVSIGDSGGTMEIRGRMMDPALLADYIRRLDAEPAFKGREFSALKISTGGADAQDQAPAAASPAPAPASRPAPTGAAGTAPPVPAVARFYEFALSPILPRQPSKAERPDELLPATPGVRR